MHIHTKMHIVLLPLLLLWLHEVRVKANKQHVRTHLDQRVRTPACAQHQHHWLLRLLLQLQPATLAGAEQPVNGLNPAGEHTAAAMNQQVCKAVKACTAAGVVS
jgi:hypothetical protein